MAEETTPATAEKKPNTTMGLLCYLGILVVIPMFAVKAEDRDDFLKNHLRQGLGLLIFEFVLSVLRSVIGSNIVSLILGVLVLVLFVLAIIGIVKAVSGKTEKLPLFGDLFDKIGGSIVK